MGFLVLFFSLSSLSDAPIVEHQIADDGWVEVPLDFTFPFYGNSYVTSFMFSNGVVGFLDPFDVPGSGYIHDGLCCSGQNFEGGATGVRFNYTIMPWHTDLIDAGAGRFYTQGDSTYQKYMWENLAEYYDRNSENSFDLTIYPLGNIEINYTELDIDNHSVTVAIVGDLSAGEYEQWFYNHPTNGAIFWNNTEDDPVIIDEGESICSVVPDSHLSCLYYPETYADAYYEEQCNLSSLYDAGCVGYWDAYTDQQCGLDSLWSSACPNFETAYLDQQCETNPTYSVYCRGYEEAIAEEEIEFEEAQLEEIFVLPPPEIYIEIELPDLIEFEILVESYEVDLPEIAIEEITEQQIIAEIEAEIEEFFEPLPEIEPEPEIEELVEEPVEEEPIEEPIEEVEEVEEEPETEEVEEEQQEQQPEEQEEVQVAVVKAEPKESTKKEKADSKKDKIREIITNKLNNLAKEMGAAVSLEEQKNLQSYILALLNFNAGFNDYKGSLVDGTFYEDKDIYLNKTIPDNRRGLKNGLANQILHNKLVDLQWQK